MAVDDGSGNLTIPRTALKDAVFATSGYEGLTGIITCTPLGDCATDVTIGVFKYNFWPVEGGAKPDDPVFSETLDAGRRRLATSGTARCGWALGPPAAPRLRMD